MKSIFNGKMVQEAEAFAREKHHGQKWGDQPYSFHLKEVVNLLKTHNGGQYATDILLSSAWLHDVIEDTDADDVDIMRITESTIVVDIVGLLSDPEGINRKERKRKFYERLKSQLAAFPEVVRAAIIVKFADRIVNVEKSITEMGNKDGQKFFKLYNKEHTEFYDTLVPILLSAKFANHEKLIKRYDNLMARGRVMMRFVRG